MFITPHPITKNRGRANVLRLLLSRIPTALTQSREA